jgi:hypothetical protein
LVKDIFNAQNHVWLELEIMQMFHLTHVDEFVVEMIEGLIPIVMLNLGIQGSRAWWRD